MTRPAASIGAGLAAARPARAIRPAERIHVVGVAGAGASAAALLAHHAGGSPDGCDPGGPSPYTPPLEEARIPLAWAHDPRHVVDGRPDRLAVTKALTAVDPDHPELAAARALGIAIEPWQQVVADAAVGRRLVGVAGTHGKSTTSGWLVHLLVAAGRDPSAFVGALLPASVTGGLPSTARWGRGDTFVVEADEYAGNFDPYRPAVSIVTSVEWDHPDVFADLDQVVGAFVAWLEAAAGASERPVLVVNVGDPGIERLLERLLERLGAWPGAVVPVGIVDEGPERIATDRRTLADRFGGTGDPGPALLARILEAAPDSTTLEIHGLDQSGGPTVVRLPSAGRHNAANALGVAGGGMVLGLATSQIATGLATFPGIGRRLERKGEAAGVVVFDDYAHHPTAIRETLLAVRQREPGRRVWAVYEPLTYHRTAALLDAFAEALAGADAVAIADIWAGRDTDTTSLSAATLAEAVSRLVPTIPVAAPGSPETTAAWLAQEVRRGDLVLVMGGGRSYRISELLLQTLSLR
jgi:UDP-N-acetylmuramate--alanine ligase